jgi:hypothetical protein
MDVAEFIQRNADPINYVLQEIEQPLITKTPICQDGHMPLLWQYLTQAGKHRILIGVSTVFQLVLGHGQPINGLSP